MILFYSVGGGLGHLTRFGSFVRTLGITEPVTIIASSPFSRDHRVVDEKHKVMIPPFKAARSKESLVEWLQAVIDELKPDKIYIDAFPAGILGELNDVFLPTKTECFLLARIIKWDVYLERIPNFRGHFSRVFQLEDLPAEYLEFLAKYADDTEKMSLDKPAEMVPEVQIEDGAWLIIHSGPDSELQAIIGKAHEDYQNEQNKPEVLVVYPGKRPAFVPAEFRFVNLYPAYPLYSQAGRVYSAAGFNMVDQMKDYRSKHYVMPFERILDNQAERCRQHEREFAAVLKET